MVLANVWILLAVTGVLLLAIALGVLLGMRGRGGGSAGPGAPIARAERIRALPAFRRAVRRRQAALAGIVALGVLAVVLGGVVAARPVAQKTIQPVSTNRDIMLCLDVSGSMTDVDKEIVSIFDKLADGFKGERVGLTIFNSSAVQVFPLTDDYAFIQEHLRSLMKGFDYSTDVPEQWVGTMNGVGASLIGDGLASCVMRFDHADQQRARSIILATDNELNGSPIVTLGEAADYAASKKIRIYTINPVDGIDQPNSTGLSEAAATTGGKAYALRETTTVGDIVAQVQKQEASQLKGQATVIWTDVPQLWIAALIVVALGFVVLLWRVRL
ncbi:VWA domain-containing protein [Microbacterium azadirachtae]|uniref:VWA domain-containing protein n=1 Tax=Microbacterium azadirachtae TaxID=582680 RepID=UPI0021D4AC28|nr:VWA domain-containing protein [Microbacterium azadirachtae]UXW86066.1 VWA domain-containing protein [Microbacterium azadirachtae]